MKNLLLLSLLAVATIEAPAVLAAPTQTEPSTAKSAKQRRADRRAKTPQVYKGTVAEQSRLVTDAAGSEDDQASGDDTGKKAKKAKRKN